MVGTALSFTRSLGEFGAVIFIAGNMPYISEITSLMIFVRLQEFDFCRRQCHCLSGADDLATAITANKPVAGALSAPHSWTIRSKT